MRNKFIEVEQPTELEIYNCHLLAEGQIGDAPLCEAVLQLHTRSLSKRADMSVDYAYKKVCQIRKECSATRGNDGIFFPCDEVREEMKKELNKVE